MDLKFHQHGWAVKTVFNECELPISCKFHTKRREEGEVSQKLLGKGGHQKNLIQIHSPVK